MLYCINTIFLLEAFTLVVADAVSFFNYNDKTFCNIRGFEKTSTFYIWFWVVTRILQTVTGPTVAIIIFWRKRIKRLSKIELLEKKRKELEQTLDGKFGGRGADSGNGPRFSLRIYFQSNLSPFSNIQTHFIFVFASPRRRKLR